MVKRMPPPPAVRPDGASGTRSRGCGTERPARRLDRAGYRERNRVERLVGRLKRCRRVATRYEKRAVHFLAMVTLAILLWL